MKQKKIPKGMEQREINVKVVFQGSIYEYETAMMEPVGEKGKREILVTIVPNLPPRIGSRLRDANGKLYDY